MKTEPLNKIREAGKSLRAIVDNAETFSEFVHAASLLMDCCRKNSIKVPEPVFKMAITTAVSRMKAMRPHLIKKDAFWTATILGEKVFSSTPNDAFNKAMNQKERILRKILDMRSR